MSSSRQNSIHRMPFTPPQHRDTDVHTTTQSELVVSLDQEPTSSPTYPAQQPPRPRRRELHPIGILDRHGWTYIADILPSMEDMPRTSQEQRLLSREGGVSVEWSNAFESVRVGRAKGYGNGDASCASSVYEDASSLYADASSVYEDETVEDVEGCKKAKKVVRFSGLPEKPRFSRCVKRRVGGQSTAKRVVGSIGFWFLPGYSRHEEEENGENEAENEIEFEREWASYEQRRLSKMAKGPTEIEDMVDGYEDIVKTEWERIPKLGLEYGMQDLRPQRVHVHAAVLHSASPVPIYKAGEHPHREIRIQPSGDDEPCFTTAEGVIATIPAHHTEKLSAIQTRDQDVEGNPAVSTPDSGTLQITPSESAEPALAPTSNPNGVKYSFFLPVMDIPGPQNLTTMSSVLNRGMNTMAAAPSISGPLKPPYTESVTETVIWHPNVPAMLAERRKAAKTLEENECKAKSVWEKLRRGFRR